MITHITKTVVHHNLQNVMARRNLKRTAEESSKKEDTARTNIKDLTVQAAMIAKI